MKPKMTKKLFTSLLSFIHTHMHSHFSVNATSPVHQTQNKTEAHRAASNPRRTACCHGFSQIGGLMVGVHVDICSDTEVHQKGDRYATDERSRCMPYRRVLQMNEAKNDQEAMHLSA